MVDSNKLTHNVNQTQKLMLSWKKMLNPKGKVIIRNEAIQRATTAKILSVVVDQILNWKDHISMIKSKKSNVLPDECKLIRLSHVSCTCIYHSVYYFDRSCCLNRAVTPSKNAESKRVFYGRKSMSNISKGLARSYWFIPRSLQHMETRTWNSQGSLYCNTEALPLHYCSGYINGIAQNF